MDRDPHFATGFDLAPIRKKRESGRPRKDLTGQRFGRLAVVALAGKSKSGNYTWNCACDCGGKLTVAGGSLTAGQKSCGCSIGNPADGSQYVKSEKARKRKKSLPLGLVQLGLSVAAPPSSEWDRTSLSERFCYGCSRMKSLSDFRLKRNGNGERKPYSKCKPCDKREKKQYARQMAENTKRRRIDGRRIIETAKDRPCADCGQRFHFSAMDFDHLDSSRKIRSIASMATCRRERIVDEMAKCDVVCANCHRVRTWKRRNNLPI